MSPPAVIQTLLEAIQARAKINAIVRSSDDDMQHRLAILSPSETNLWPKKVYRRLDSQTLDLLQTGIEADDRSLKYELSFQHACFPKDSKYLHSGDGIETAAKFSFGYGLLSSTVRSLASYESRLEDLYQKKPDHLDLDLRYPLDYILSSGTEDANGHLAWKGFGYIDNQSSQACVMGLRASTNNIPLDAILGSELTVLLLLISSSKPYYTQTSAIFSFTNTDARVIQAAVLPSKDGSKVVFNIVYTAPLAPNPDKAWKRMLQWAFWSRDEGDDFKSGKDLLAATEKKAALPYREIKSSKGKGSGAKH